MTTAELAKFIAPYLSTARAIALSANCKTVPTSCKPSKRTYYLGTNGRVSQRKHLVGELLATVRACSTDHARYLFAEARLERKFPFSTPKPYIGEPELCKCGWHHAKRSECPVCANWKHIGESILAGTAEA